MPADLSTMLTIDRATLDDLPAVRALLATASLPIDDVDATLLGDFYVARDISGDVRGVVGLQRAGRDALLRSPAVASAARSEGIGAKLVATVEEHARVTCVHRLYLLTTSAAAFFATRGYSILGRDAAPEGIRGTAQFAGLCPASSTFMVKSLTHGSSLRMQNPAAT